MVKRNDERLAEQLDEPELDLHGFEQPRKLLDLIDEHLVPLLKLVKRPIVTARQFNAEQLLQVFIPIRFHLLTLLPRERPHRAERETRRPPPRRAFRNAAADDYAPADGEDHDQCLLRAEHAYAAFIRECVAPPGR